MLPVRNLKICAKCHKPPGEILCEMSQMCNNMCKMHLMSHVDLELCEFN